MSGHLLYVEDDASLSFVTRDNLERAGYQVTAIADGKSALAALAQDSFDLCIFDVMLPEVDGFALAAALRQRDAATPILFLTAKSLPEDRIHGLKIGGDDYLTKPFSMEELLLKVDIFLRRRQVQAPVVGSSSAVQQLGGFVFDPANLTLEGFGQVRRLTQKEANLLQYLHQRPHQVLRRADILTQIWGEDDYFLGRSLDVFVSRLRKYLQADSRIKIENVHGIGFQFNCPDND